MKWEITLRVFRFDPERERKPKFAEYEVPVDEYTRVLEALLWVKENIDPSLNLRYSCRMAMCGSCGMLINNKPRLACKTIIKTLKTDVVEVKPLPKFKVIRDLVVEMDDFFDKHRSVKPYLIRRNVQEQENPTGFYFQTSEEVRRYIQFAYCIMCGLCSSSCPIFRSGGRYLGPQALAQAFRYLADSRDEGFDVREKILNSDKGVWRCHFAGECSEACPKGVEPAEAIQRLRRKLL
ncbi:MULTISPECIES: succinate dehydrogenase iron-sulfur subunit [unclassified Archaeoglobus]|jgi:succinate dehydrogenase / fumarate reductase iron-sulfur subunit|uniref:succinate dehydrogenase iron-sulfur subunit n=1 Tax=unclassified Archaeoglobus TaxID=2643606 RepID=UPI0025C009BC|nr:MULTISPECIES: succinate dehydrogenase iron-sulfur subunit [unclassified Archaeoglobus]